MNEFDLSTIKTRSSWSYFKQLSYKSPLNKSPWFHHVCWINRDKPSIFMHVQGKSGNSHISPAFFHVFWPSKRQLGQLGAGGRYELLGGGHRSGLRLQCPGPVKETWWGILMNLGVHHVLRDRQYMYVCVYIYIHMYVYIYVCIYICMYSIYNYIYVCMYIYMYVYIYIYVICE